eukprot:symbB.v1.2.015397.t1/scaffold1144.1/size135540/5
MIQVAMVLVILALLGGLVWLLWSNREVLKAWWKHTFPTRCSFSEWSDWADCTTTCGVGSNSAERSFFPQDCSPKPTEGDLKRFRPCEEEECVRPVHCSVSAWTSWSACSEACGSGVRSRERHEVIAPNSLGRPCPATFQEWACEDVPCSHFCHVTPWSAWGPCSVSCGQGRMHRSRTSIPKDELQGGVHCPPEVDTSICKLEECSEQSHCIFQVAPRVAHAGPLETCNMTRAEATCEVNCDVGFQEDRALHCSGGVRFLRSRCLPQRCGFAARPRHAVTSWRCDDLMDGAQCFLDCQASFQSSSNFHCSLGHLNVPHCYLETCRSPPIPLHSTALFLCPGGTCTQSTDLKEKTLEDCRGLQDGEKCHFFACAHGFVKTDELTCTSFNFNRPRCIEKPCFDAPPHVAHSVVDLTDGVAKECRFLAYNRLPFPSRAACPLKCDNGYVPTGAAVCGAGRWHKASCVPIGMGGDIGCHGVDAQAPLGAEVTCEDRLYPSGSSCSVTCPTGYRKVHDLLCAGNQWLPALCDAGCLSAPLVQHSEDLSSCAGSPQNSTCRVKCIAGFEPFPKDEVVCHLGRWSSTSCRERACPMPGRPHFAVGNYSDCEGRKHGELCHLQCAEGFTPHPTARICEKGHWTVAFCEPLPCGFPVVHDSGDLSICKGYPSDSMCELSCAAGHIKAGANLRCERGQWREAMCWPWPGCGVPPVLQNAGTTADLQNCINLRRGQRCTAFHCNLGFEAAKDDVLRCLPRGFFSRPRCLPTPCGQARSGLPHSRSEHCQGTSSGGICRISCDVGYSPRAALHCLGGAFVETTCEAITGEVSFALDESLLLALHLHLPFSSWENLQANHPGMRSARLACALSHQSGLPGWRLVAKGSRPYSMTTTVLDLLLLPASFSTTPRSNVSAYEALQLARQALKLPKNLLQRVLSFPSGKPILVDKLEAVSSTVGKMCIQLPSLSHAKDLSFCAFTLSGHACPLVCEEGYVHSGTLACQDGEWLLPSCVEISCDHEPKVENAEDLSHCKTSASGSLCPLECQAGYLRTGDLECRRAVYSGQMRCHALHVVTFSLLLPVAAYRILIEDQPFASVELPSDAVQQKEFYQCTRQCRWKYGLNLTIVGGRSGWSHCQCFRGTEVLSIIPRFSDKDFDTTNTWSGTETSGWNCDFVCVQKNGEILTVTKEEAEQENDLVKLHCGRCAACSAPEDIEVLAKTRTWITEVMTKVAARFAAPWGHQDPQRLRRDLLEANISFSEKRYDNRTDLPSCMDNAKNYITMPEDKGHGYAGGWSESGFDSSIPVWDGRADSLREFKKTVTWWLCSINLEKTKEFNLAARFAMKQKGSAKLRALEFEPSELEYTPAEEAEDPDSHEMIVITPAVYDTGIKKILAAWDDMVGRTVTDRKGELRERFYLSMKRNGGESVVAFALRYRTLVAEMKSEGITIDDSEVAWFYKQKLVLTEMQRQMLETSLGANTESYVECEKESDAVKLRSRMGIREAFLEDDLVSRAIEMTKKPNKAKMKEAHAMEVHRLVNLGEGERLERLQQLLGPRGGLPRLKGELLELAVLLRVETEPTDTIEKLKAKLQPTVALMKSQPSGAQVPVKPKPPPAALAGRGRVMGSRLPHFLSTGRRGDAMIEVAVTETDTAGGAPGEDGQRLRCGCLVKQSIGSIPPEAFEKFKPGQKQRLLQAAQKGLRELQALGTSQTEVAEALEVEELNKEMWAVDGMNEAFIAHVGIGKFGEHLPIVTEDEVEPPAPALWVDQWRFGHQNGWLVRDHGAQRRRLYVPSDLGTSWPRYFPKEAFMGPRITEVFNEDGTRREVIEDDFRHPPRKYINQPGYMITSLQVDCNYLDYTRLWRRTWSSHLRSKSLFALGLQPASTTWTMETEFTFSVMVIKHRVFTDTEPVVMEARRRGHVAMHPSITLSTGYDLTKDECQERAKDALFMVRPFLTVMAFPCTVWSPLQHLGRNRDAHRQRQLRKWRRIQKKLVNWVVTTALGLHYFLIENPSLSAAWKEVAALKQLFDHPEEYGFYKIQVDQCQFGLVGPGGGHYPIPLARAIVNGAEKQFNVQVREVYEAHEVQAMEHEGGDDAAAAAAGAIAASVPIPEIGSDSEDVEDIAPEVPADGADPPSAAIRKLVRRIHENTGHRSRFRLARALAIAGAHASAVRAARELRCEICLEQSSVRTRRPASLPTPKAFNDHLYSDLFSLKDQQDNTFWIAHAIDAASRYFSGRVLRSKSAEDVVGFFTEVWFPALGIPRTLTCDMGPEYISEAFQNMCERRNIVLDHVSPMDEWACRTSRRSFEDFDEVVLGRNPRIMGANFKEGEDKQSFLSQHSLMDTNFSFAKQVALRECARRVPGGPGVGGPGIGPGGGPGGPAKPGAGASGGSGGPGSGAPGAGAGGGPGGAAGGTGV